MMQDNNGDCSMMDCEIRDKEMMENNPAAGYYINLSDSKIYTEVGVKALKSPPNELCQLKGDDKVRIRHWIEERGTFVLTKTMELKKARAIMGNYGQASLVAGSETIDKIDI